MKEKMKKLTLLTFYKEKEGVTSSLQELGVVHIESTGQEGVEVLGQLQKERNEWLKALEILNRYKETQTAENNPGGSSPEDLKELVLQYEKQLNQLSQQLDLLQKEEHQLVPWGDFSWHKIEVVKSQDIHFRFFAATKKEFKSFNFKILENATHEIVSERKGLVRFVVIHFGETPPLPFNEIQLPNTSLSQIHAEKQRIAREVEAVSQHLSGLTFAIPLFEKALALCNDKIEREEAIKSYDGKADGKIEVLKGWFPKRNEPEVLGFLKAQNLSFEIVDPGPADKVPVILRNRKYPRVFETITRIFQLPNYYEFDLTPFIAVFYPIFFAYCLGDAGYGLILLLISAIAGINFLKKMKGVAILGMILGVITTITGIIKSGTLFGIPITQNRDIPLFDFLSGYVLITDDQDYIFNAFNVALMIGVVQILIAVFISIVRKVRYEGFFSSLDAVGKLFIIVSTIVLFLGSMQKMELFIPHTGIAKVVLVVGVVMVLAFHDVNQPLGRRLGSGVLPLYFIFTGLLGDVLSYIRLFALGVASSILGLVVNQIGSQIMDGAGIVGIAVAVVFFIFGHTINFLLASLGAFVHPLRLTFVEFYNNANFKGGGVVYRPFKKQVNS